MADKGNYVETVATVGVGSIRRSRETLIMKPEHAIERLFQTLRSGQRGATYTLIGQLQADGWTCEELTDNLYRPTLTLINQLFRAEQLSELAYNSATGVLGVLAVQAQNGYEQQPAAARSTDRLNTSPQRYCQDAQPTVGTALAAAADSWQCMRKVG